MERGIRKHPIGPRMEKYMRRHYEVSERLSDRYFETRDALSALLAQCGPYSIPQPMASERDRLERLMDEFCYRRRMMDRRLYRPSIIVAYQNFRHDEAERIKKEARQKSRRRTKA